MLVKAIEDAALGMASVYRGLEACRCPPMMPLAHEGTSAQFAALLAKIHAVRSGHRRATRPTGEEARVSQDECRGSWGAISGKLRYFADAYGNPRAAIEGTNLPMDVIRRHATGDEATLAYDGERRKAPLVLRRRVEYYGFELEHEVERGG